MMNVKDRIEKKFGHYPEKILQFGEGNFLRAFADWMVDLANEDGVYHGSIVLCQPISQGMADRINEQDGVYTVVMRGIEQGEPVERVRRITSVSRCLNPYTGYEAVMALAESPDMEVIISNTTEAGIAYHEGDLLTDAPPASYPAKLCAFLYRRYQAFHGAADKGMLILPVELIDNNGARLKELVLRYAREWALGEDFTEWVCEHNEFTSTLVDRIVTGYPRDTIGEFEEKLGYEDHCLVTCELFNLWVIEGRKEWADRLPIHKTQANVLWTSDVTPYKKRKVRILNGSHTAMVPCAYIAGYNTVLEFFTGSPFGDFERSLINEEIIPAVDLPREELTAFAADVTDRFTNPFIKHFLYDITLNNCSKFCARCLPTMQDYYGKTGAVPPRFAFALAGFIRFYNIHKDGGTFTGRRDNGETYVPKDDADVLEFFAGQWASGDRNAVVHNTLNHVEFWDGYDLCQMEGLEETVLRHLKNMVEHDMMYALDRF